MSKQIIGAMDGDKLFEWMYSNGYFSLKSADMIADEWEKGTFRLDDQGEATRLYDDISEAINIWEWMQMDDDPAETMDRVIRKLHEALSSSHREDGIQKVQEEWEAQNAGGNTLICAAIEGTAKALGYTIPGITEER